MSARPFASLLVLVPLALPAPAPPHIRLDGEFKMTGRVTVAHDVPGEHAGERVTRRWEFMAPCPEGQCTIERLIRSRAAGQDKVKLKRKRRVFSHWVGKGSFYAPIRCGSRIYKRGERVRFTIKVRITGVTMVDGAPVATSVKASYASYRRTNRTRCFAVLGHDAAAYTGTLITPAPVQSAPIPAPS